MSDATQTFRVYGSWAGVTAPSGDLNSSFSNLRLQFSNAVADGGVPGLTTPEELLLGAAVAGYCTAFVDLAGEMIVDLANLEVTAELQRGFDELEGNRLQEIRLAVEAELRTGVGFEKVHDMFRRAASLAKQRSPVLRALDGAIKIRVEPSYRESRPKS